MLVELIENPLGFIKATFEFKQAQDIEFESSRRLRITLDIHWMDTQAPSPVETAEIRKMIANSNYGLNEPIHCADCYWHNIMAVITRCHEQARQFSKHIVTNIHIDDNAEQAQLKKDVEKMISEQTPMATYAISD
jgi:hypothetical protein